MVTKKILAFIFICSGISTSLFAYSDSLQIQRDPTDEILTGQYARIELQQGVFGYYFHDEYRNFEPDLTLLDHIKNKIYSSNITVVLGSWCHDSHQQVPRFIKILDKIDYNTGYLNIICVDKEKKAGDIDISGLNIEKVPTFIFFRNEREVGRIVETPIHSLEIDMYHILNK